MMTELTGYVRKWQRSLRRVFLDPALRDPVMLGLSFLGGFLLSAASLAHTPQPFPVGVLCGGLPGWLPLPFALGASLGYFVFWGRAGIQGIVWIAAALPVGVLLGNRRQQIPLLLPSLGALLVSASGVIFQLWLGEDTPILLYLMRVLLAFAGAWVWVRLRNNGQDPTQWVAMAIGVLALAQIAPVGLLNLGIVAAAMLVPVTAFPAVALAGLALDFSQVTQVPMTAVLCLSYLLRLLPQKNPGILRYAPALVYVPVMALCGKLDLLPLPALLLGGFASLLLPQQTPIAQHRSDTGFAQVRLEMAAGVLLQTEQLLLETPQTAVDEQALMEKTALRACGSCPCRKNCRQAEQAKTMPVSLLYTPLTGTDDLPVDCKKRGRLLLELRRTQDSLRAMQADRQRQQEYRGALLQQLRFLAEYLQDLSEKLPQRGKEEDLRYRPEVAVYSTGKELSNGDLCQSFAGTEGKYYLLLCDGMGTGMGAAQEAKTAVTMLKRLLMAGYPAPYALRSLNSLCTLRSRAGAVTVDLAELQLQTGRVTLYKWGAAPSYVLLSTGPEKIGQPGLPPGLALEGQQETVDRLTLRKREALVLLSDGVDGQKAEAVLKEAGKESCGSLAARLLEKGKSANDDATVAVVRLEPVH